MDRTATHGVQLFVERKGKLAHGRFLECTDAGEACRVAAETVHLGQAVGAAAFTRTVTDSEYDDGEEPVALATFGRVPPGVADRLPF